MRRSAEVEDAVRRFYDAMASGDVAAVDALIADDAAVMFVGTDDAEWWTGRAAVVGAFRSQLQVMGTVEIVGGDPLGYTDGELAWAVDHPSFRMADGAEIPIRLTAVARRDEASGEWRFLHAHVSTGVPNAELVSAGRTPSTPASIRTTPATR